MKRIRCFHFTVVLMLVGLTSLASADWLFHSTDTAALRLEASNPSDGSAMISGPGGTTVTARLQDEIGTEGMTLVEIRANHVILQKGKTQLRLLVQPSPPDVPTGPASGLAVPPGPPSN
jgi:hypothetical protein